MEVWTGPSAGTAAPSEIIDLRDVEGQGGGAAEVATQSAEEPVQGVRRGGHLPAQSEKEPMQGVRRGGHLRAQSAKEPMQGVRRGELSL